MKSIFAAAALMTAVAVAPLASAEAAVIYNFAGVSQPGAAAPVPLNIQLVLTSAETVFSIVGNGDANGNQTTLRGDVDRFISMTIGRDGVGPSFVTGMINFALAFDSVGNVTGSSLVYDGSSYDARLTGTGSTASGLVAQAQSPCRIDTATCAVSGAWTVSTPTSVPEPMSIALFGAGLAGLAMVRRRKA
ncbi:PEP-CTERM sorting domain-containing protein [Roseomonas haemaphysalidis]|jgi:hypothetical protein|uniref:PEP-CTERM sorting domain-containing protein n=1 Tax=Roseomonas haemaphysalidis TaxID=2768162 RepID=A0ABS3KXK4_9PROT|nr:PEP-CTERM sorting domain-containing protein [Roseomonas haemaphysalidis]MBO1081647.1 PEP-CTERM sorting domain-containing protein [Roseomonas haemaphysalidis]